MAQLNRRRVMVTWLVSRGDRGVGVSTRNRLGGILSEIIAPVESSLSDSVLKTVFLLGSDYSLSEPHPTPVNKPGLEVLTIQRSNVIT